MRLLKVEAGGWWTCLGEGLGVGAGSGKGACFCAFSGAKMTTE